MGRPFQPPAVLLEGERIMSVTIKNVLDRFAAEELAPYRADGDPLFGWRTTKRKLCPMQVFFCRYPVASFIEAAKYSGMPNSDIERIMIWADTGKWPTFNYYYDA